MSNTEKPRKLEEIAAVAARSLTTSNSGRKFKRSKATILAALREAAEGMKRRAADVCRDDARASRAAAGLCKTPHGANACHNSAVTSDQCAAEILALEVE